jgi:predicted nuclease with TOPRIM domain
MTEEIRYIVNIQRQEEFDNEVTELKDELKRLEQENKELRAYKDINEDFKKAWDELNEKYKQLRSALEKIRDLCIHYENTNDKCVINCYAHFIVTDLIQDKINEVLK